MESLNRVKSRCEERTLASSNRASDLGLFNRAYRDFDLKAEMAQPASKDRLSEIPCAFSKNACTLTRAREFPRHSTKPHDAKFI